MVCTAQSGGCCHIEPTPRLGGMTCVCYVPSQRAQLTSFSGGRYHKHDTQSMTQAHRTPAHARAHTHTAGPQTPSAPRRQHAPGSSSLSCPHSAMTRRVRCAARSRGRQALVSKAHSCSTTSVTSGLSKDASWASVVVRGTTSTPLVVEGPDTPISDCNVGVGGERWV
jgi:hypothetical protein